MQLLGGEKHLQGAGLADPARKSLRASPTGDEAQYCATMAEDSMRACDAATACQGQVETSTHAIALNGSYGRSREVGDGAHQALAHVCEPKGLGTVQLGDLVEVGSRGEEVRVAGYDELRGRILGELLDYCCHRANSGAGEAVCALIGEKTQDGNIVMKLNFAELFRGLNARLWYTAE